MLEGAMVLPCDADREAARIETKRQFAIRLKRKGLSHEEIAELAELSLAEVEDALMPDAVSA